MVTDCAAPAAAAVNVPVTMFDAPPPDPVPVVTTPFANIAVLGEMMSAAAAVAGVALGKHMAVVAIALVPTTMPQV